MEERIIFGGMGGCVGYFIATMMKIIAHANVHVRPELANVSWWEALLARHFTDWRLSLRKQSSSWKKSYTLRSGSKSSPSGNSIMMRSMCALSEGKLSACGRS